MNNNRSTALPFDAPERAPPRAPVPGEMPELSVVIPCLNEMDTLGTCIAKAQRAIALAGLRAEIVVADNGSTDGSRELALRLGARVVEVAARGYGSALMGGIGASRGRYVLMGDADDSYDFGEAPRFVAKLREGYDLVQGCRLPSGGGRILPGAMPFLHRWVGNPMLSWLARTWFKAPVSDVYCGMRAFTRQLYDDLGQVCTGMEFATENIIKASLAGARIGEIPISLHPDGRTSHRPHLRTFRDGWRTLRFFLLYSPRWLFLAPGSFLVAMGLFCYLVAMPGLRVGRIHPDIHTLLVGSMMIICGYQAVLFALFTKVFAITEGLLPPDSRVARIQGRIRLETGLAWGALAGLVGLALISVIVNRWRVADFGRLDYVRTLRWVIPGVTLVVVGVQTVFSSFFLSILALARSGPKTAADVKPSLESAPPEARTAGAVLPATLRRQRASAILDSRWAPGVAGVLSALAVWYVWGSLRQVPWVQDEFSLLFQARLFATGRWAAPQPPLPAFFEQYHVLVTPAFASKYYPGHPLVLVPGVALGIPGLMPVLLSGLAGALLYALARRVADPRVALLTWLVWIGGRGNLLLRASYFTEVTTSVLLLTAWLALLRWRDGRKPGWLLALAALTGLAAVTRPLTALAFALPIGVVVVRDAFRTGCWRSLALATAVGAAFLMIIPIWSAQITGKWYVTPYALHTRQYLPFDKLGFGLHDQQPSRPPTADMERLNEQIRAIHRDHTLARLPVAAARRVLALGRVGLWADWRVALLPLALLGLVGLSRPAAFAVASAALVFCAYLGYAHSPAWVLYYLEILPVLAFLIARGTGRLGGYLASLDASAGPPARQRTESARGATLAFALVLLLLLPWDLREARGIHASQRAPFQAWRAALAAIPRTERALVFVRYGRQHSPHLPLVMNDPDLYRSRIVLAHDRGAEDELLMARMPGRKPYLLREGERGLLLTPMPVRRTR